MLVLTRKIGEKIHIGPDIVITVVEIGTSRVRLGLDVPREIPVYREELLPIPGFAPAVQSGTVPQKTA